MRRKGVLRKVVMSVSAVAIGLTATMAVTSVQPRTAHAAAAISSVSFKAPVHTSYDHAVGGGAWNDGSTTYVKGELQGTDYACGDYASFMVRLETTAGSPLVAPYKAVVTIDFTIDATGQSGVALVPDTSASHLKVNYPLESYTAANVGGTRTDGATKIDAGFDASVTASAAPTATISSPSVTRTGTIYTTGSTDRLSFTVNNLGASKDYVIRMDAKIECKAGASPTGNLQASLQSVVVTNNDGTGTPENAGSGAQTVNFRGVGNLAGLGGTPSPALSVTKLVVGSTSTCPVITAAQYPPTGDRTTTISNALRTVKYCYYVKNTGTGPAYGVTLEDDNATIDNTADDYDVTLSGLTRIDAQGGNNDLAAGSLAVGEQVVVYSSVGSFTNIASATALNMTKTSTATARVTNLGIIAFDKTILLPGESSCATGATSKYVAIDSILATESITYCFAITNYLGSDLLNATLSVVDDNATADGTDDDTITSFSGLTDLDTGGVLNDLANGSSAYASLTLSLSTATPSFLNTASAAVSGTVSSSAYTAPAMTSKAKVVFNEEIESQYVPDPPPPPLVGSLSITKQQTSPSPVKVGDTITYTITVTNTGTIALDEVTITDPNAVLGACLPANPMPQLRVNQSITCTATHVVTAADAEAGRVVNTAYAIAKNGGQSIGQTGSNNVETPVTKVGVAESAVPKSGKPGDTGARRSGDPEAGPGSLPETGADFTALLTGMWLVIGGFLLSTWARPMRRRRA